MELFAVIVSVVAIFFAFFQGEIWAYIKRPNLSAKLEDVHLTWVQAGANQASCLFSRLIVERSGDEVAREVEVFADALFQIDATTGQPVPVPGFPRMNLKWAHIGRTKQDIGAIPKACDIGRLTDQYTGGHQDLFETIAKARAGLPANTRMFTLETEVQPNHARNILPPGTYSLHLIVAAANASPISMKIGIQFPGGWLTAHGGIASALNVNTI
jgi:hypothetical protein